MDRNSIIEYSSKLQLLSQKWHDLLVNNELSTEQKALVLETLALIAIAIDVCHELLNKGASPRLIEFTEKLARALAELVRLCSVINEKIDFDSLPNMPF